jgi:biopolymer transport protein ExbD
MQFQRPHRKKHQVSVIPLINVIFLLLMFFIVAGTIEVVDTLDVALPMANSGVSKPPVNAVIYLGRDGNVAINSDLVSKKDLKTIIKTLFIENPEQKISIKSDAGVPAQTLVMIMNLIEESGGTDVSLVTEVGEK